MPTPSDAVRRQADQLADRPEELEREGEGHRDAAEDAQRRRGLAAARRLGHEDDPERLVGDDRLDYLDIVERNVWRLNVLVEDLLAFGAGRAGRTDPASSTDLARLCTETVEVLAPFAADRGVDLT